MPASDHFMVDLLVLAGPPEGERCRIIVVTLADSDAHASFQTIDGRLTGAGRGFACVEGDIEEY